LRRAWKLGVRHFGSTGRWRRLVQRFGSLKRRWRRFWSEVLLIPGRGMALRSGGISVATGLHDGLRWKDLAVI
jgi:hypothetical protein